MTEESDKKCRDELKDLIKKSKLDEVLKKKLLDFAEELSNGRLEQLLQKIKESISENN